MTIPDRPTFDSIDPRWQIRITDDGSPTLVDRANGDSMHSGCGAIAETEHVYLRNSGVAERLKEGLTTRILEVGLGSGLGCLMSADLAKRCDTKIEYVALEQNLPTAELVTQLAFDQHGIDRVLIDEYRELLSRSSNEKTICGEIGRHCSLTIYHGNALTWNGEDEAPFDAIYFDPYSPETNAELWTAAYISLMLKKLAVAGRLVSYCVNRKVRDTLTEVGFTVNRVPGPIGGKREVLIATNLAPIASVTPREKRWG